MSLYRVAVTGLTWLAGNAGHETGDYPVQRDQDARNKQCHTRPHTPLDADDERSPAQRTRDGWRALATHAATYGAAQFATKLAAYRATGLRVPITAVVAGQVVEVVLHMAIDDGRLLLKLADATGKRRFHDLAAGGVNGRMLLDQALHKGVQIPAGALVTGAVAAWMRR